MKTISSIRAPHKNSFFVSLCDNLTDIVYISEKHKANQPPEYRSRTELPVQTLQSLKPALIAAGMPVCVGALKIFGEMSLNQQSENVTTS